ncbi:hypothetical protein SMICM17S_08138 [Streptomyces microflavus]
MAAEAAMIPSSLRARSLSGSPRSPCSSKERSTSRIGTTCCQKLPDASSRNRTRRASCRSISVISAVLSRGLTTPPDTSMETVLL